jgi:hypothetical protein
MRQIDPRAPLDEGNLAALGWESQAELLARLEELRAFLASPVLLYTWTVGPYFRENIGSVGAASYTTRAATPTDVTSWQTTAIAEVAPWPGLIIAGWLWSNQARTAGSAWLRVRITQGGINTDYDLTECALDGGTDEWGNVRTQTACAYLDPPQGIPFAAGALLDARIVCDATFAPTTADMGCKLLAARLISPQGGKR